jgi:hypothetical protein
MCTHTDRMDVEVDKDMHTVGALTASPLASTQMSRSIESASIYVREFIFSLPFTEPCPGGAPRRVQVASRPNSLTSGNVLILCTHSPLCRCYNYHMRTLNCIISALSLRNLEMSKGSGNHSYCATVLDPDPKL